MVRITGRAMVKMDGFPLGPPSQSLGIARAQSVFIELPSTARGGPGRFFCYGGEGRRLPQAAKVLVRLRAVPFL
jgi:hypothetical protein